MQPINSSAPGPTTLVTSTVAAAVTAISTATAVVTAPPGEDISNSSGEWIATIAKALSIESVNGISADALSLEALIGVSQDTVLFVASVTKDSAFAAMSLVSTVNALRRCLNEGFVSVSGLVALTSGLNAATTLDRIATAGVGIGVGIGHFGFFTGGMVNLATLINRASQGDIPGALLSGTKLVATIALTGHPVALGIVIAADATYGAYCMYTSYFAVDDESSSPPRSFDVGYPGPLNEVLEQLLAHVPEVIPVD